MPISSVVVSTDGQEHSHPCTPHDCPHRDFPSLDDIVAVHSGVCHGAHIHAPVLAYLQQQSVCLVRHSQRSRKQEHASSHHMGEW